MKPTINTFSDLENIEGNSVYISTELAQWIEDSGYVKGNSLQYYANEGTECREIEILGIR